MMIFTYRLLSDEVEDFVRDIQIPFDATLFDFHKFIMSSLKYNPCENASFFESDSEWEKLREYTLFDMGAEDVDIDEDDDIEPPVPMETVKLGQATPNKFDRLIYVFDMFNERQFYVELLSASAVESGVKYPRVVAAEGDAPVQLAE